MPRNATRISTRQVFLTTGETQMEWTTERKVWRFGNMRWRSANLVPEEGSQRAPDYSTSYDCARSAEDNVS
ncbi:MAG TPA: hypothetical protein VIY86_13350 [Pirellulaceae bacterium]